MKSAKKMPQINKFLTFFLEYSHVNLKLTLPYLINTWTFIVFRENFDNKFQGGRLLDREEYTSRKEPFLYLLYSIFMFYNLVALNPNNC